MEASKQQSLFPLEKKETTQEDLIKSHNAQFVSQRTYFKGSLLEGLDKGELEDKAILNIRSILSYHSKRISSPPSRKTFMNALKTEILLKRGKASASLLQRAFILSNQ